ncbi:MAG: aminotransferase class V-fold PLP-dependent enzyme [Pirellulaceae bacterium]
MEKDALVKHSPADSWTLDPNVAFLNHGSFGATPMVVLDAQRDWIMRMEREPIHFLAPERTLLPKLDHVRQLIAQLVNAPAQDIAFVRNATEGVNAVLRSFPFAPGDEVVITNHGYNACNNAVRYAAERAGAKVVVAQLPFPIESPSQAIEAVLAGMTQRTRFLLIDHVTSPTGLVLPVEAIVAAAHDRNVRVMIDGAHAPGMIPVDLARISPDYYTANHHKWLCGPKTSGMLYVKPPYQREVRPTTISHGANTDHYGQSRFLGEFNWVGTYDPSPILSMPTALEFLNSLHDGGLTALMSRNRQLALAGRDRLLQRLGAAAPAPPEMIGSLASVPISGDAKWDPGEGRAIKDALFERYRIEVPLFQLSTGETCLRISAQAYNRLEEYDRLASAIGELLTIPLA